MKHPVRINLELKQIRPGPMALYRSCPNIYTAAICIQCFVWLTTSEWSCLISFARSPPSWRRGKTRKIKIYVSAGNRTSDPWLFSRTSTWRPLGYRESYLSAFRTLAIQWQVMRKVTLEKPTRGNAAYQIDYGYICIATDCQTICISFTNVDIIYYCLHLNFARIPQNHYQMKTDFHVLLMTGFWKRFKHK